MFLSFGKKKKSGQEGETNLLCQHHTTGSKFFSVIKKAYTYFLIKKGGEK